VSTRTISVEGPSATVVETALELIKTELHGHFWGYDTQQSVNGEAPNTPPSDRELASLLDAHIRPILARHYLLPNWSGDDRDRYTPLDKITEIYMAIGYVCAAVGYPPICNLRQIAGLRSNLEWVLQDIEWDA